MSEHIAFDSHKRYTWVDRENHLGQHHGHRLEHAPGAGWRANRSDDVNPERQRGLRRPESWWIPTTSSYNWASIFHRGPVPARNGAVDARLEPTPGPWQGPVTSILRPPRTQKL